MLPLTVSKSSVPVQSARPMLASIEPFTVSAFTRPVAATLMLPLTEAASTSDSTSPTRTPPFTVCTLSLTPAGTLTVNSTCTSLLRMWLPPWLPGSHELLRPPLPG